MKIRATLLAMTLVLVLLFASVIRAQDMGCFGLSAEDCQAISEATNNTLAAASSFTQDFSIDFKATGIPGGGDITFSVKGTGPVTMNMSAASGIPLNFASTMDVSFSGPDGDGTATLEVRLVDGILYIQNPEDGKWMGVNLAEAMSDPSALGLPVNPNDVAGAAMDPAAALEGAGLDMESLGALMGLMSVPGFLNYTRAGDTFTFTADVGTLFKSAEFSQTMAALGESMQSNPDMAQNAMMLQMVPMLFDSGIITVVQKVDPALNAVTDLSFNIDASINAGAAMGDSSAPPIVLQLAFNVKLSGIGETYEIVAPEGAEMMPMGQ